MTRLGAPSASQAVGPGSPIAQAAGNDGVRSGHGVAGAASNCRAGDHGPNEVEFSAADRVAHAFLQGQAAARCAWNPIALSSTHDRPFTSNHIAHTAADG